MKDAPIQIQKEWDLFKEEIISEADRIDDVVEAKNNNSFYNQKTTLSGEKIHQIREKIQQLSNQVEEIN